MCTYGAGEGRLRIYEGKDGNTSITTTEEACRFAASFSTRRRATGIAVSDIDFENKIIHVNGTLKYIAKAKVKYMIDEPSLK